MKKRVFVVLRWIAVPFASILGSLAAHLIGGVYALINRNGYVLYDSGTQSIGIVDIGLFLLQSFIVGVAFVLAGAYTAPSHNRIVAVVLTTLLVSLCVLDACLMMFGLANSTVSTWAGLFACSIGAIYSNNLTSK